MSILAPIDIPQARELPAGYTIQRGTPTQAEAMHALITASLEEGHLLPRTLEDLRRHAERFLVIVSDGHVVGCAELAPLSPQVAEVRSLAVDQSARRHGVGTALVEELRGRARREGYDQLCAFTHAPGYFITMGFSNKTSRPASRQARVWS